ncbi:MAG: D-lyxose/D-mannose family sugar isomerase [bacterium]|nr:D-lyxose/D-mannose family sugar isomerase [bacterium]
MRRSEINKYIREAIKTFERFQFQLPPFAYWSPEEWKSKGHEVDEIRNHALGWDITDFGLGNFERFGLILFTLRNGNLNDPNCLKKYCEKIMLVREHQVTPFHFHWTKMEDIINRMGGNLQMTLYNSDEHEKLADSDVIVSIDGMQKTFPAGTTITLRPGESITFPPKLYHNFWAEIGKGNVLVGEVSLVNDDVKDNRFLDALPRFPEIIEDEPKQFLLCSEYPPA